MKIIFTDSEREYLEKTAQEYDIPTELLEQWYVNMLDANMYEDIQDIFRNDYDAIMLEAKGGADYGK